MASSPRSRARCEKTPLRRSLRKLFSQIPFHFSKITRYTPLPKNSMFIAPQGLRRIIERLREKGLIFGYIHASLRTRLRAARLAKRSILFSPPSSVFPSNVRFFLQITGPGGGFFLKPIPRRNRRAAFLFWRLSAGFGGSSNFFGKITCRGAPAPKTQNEIPYCIPSTRASEYLPPHGLRTNCTFGCTKANLFIWYL